jgi:hypothetical protein
MRKTISCQGLLLIILITQLNISKLKSQPTHHRHRPYQCFHSAMNCI